jgi:hypothetical protein
MKIPKIVSPIIKNKGKATKSVMKEKKCLFSVKQLP